MANRRSRSPSEHERITAIEATRILNERIEQARAVLSMAISDARVFQVATAGPGDALEQAAMQPVMPLAGQAAIDAGLASLTELEYRDDQHPSATLRAPGVLLVDQDIGEHVDAVNTAKKALQRAMRPFHYAAWRRWREVVPAWSRFHRLQAYREWHLIETPLRRAGLGWAANGHGIEYLRIEALKRRLQEQLSDTGNDRIAGELAYLDGFDPFEVVVIRRPIAPTPLVNLHYVDGRKQQLTTAVPLLVRQMPKAITPLVAYRPTNRRRREDRSIEDVPLIEHWHAYRLRSELRFRLAHDPVGVRLRAQQTVLEVDSANAAEPAMIPHAGPAAMAQVAAAAAALVGANGDDTISLDREDTIRLTAANHANAFFTQAGRNVWRVPIKDLAGAARALGTS